MTEAVAPLAGGRRLAAPGARLAAAAGALAVPLAAGIGLMLLARPYLGLTGDARIYIGRAVADADPLGVGRDLMFANDGQSAFSLLPRLLDGLVQALGPAKASVVAALIGLAFWTAAAALLLRSFIGPTKAPSLFVSALAMPALYGGFLLLPGEAAAVARPSAEAFVLLGLWALLERRLWLAAGLMAAATALHPIMALAGWGVLAVDRIRADRRWLLAAAGGAIALAAAATLRLPVAGRLLQPIDAAWLDTLRFRAPYLFLHLWPADALARTTVQIVTAGLACLFLPARARALVLAVLGVAGVALAVSLLLGDGLNSLLVVQLQPWRCIWLLALFAAAAFPIALAGLWRMDGAGRLAAGALAVGWAALSFPQVALPFAALAVGLWALAQRGVAPSRPILVGGWAVIVAVGALLLGAQTWWLGLQLAGPAAARYALHFLLLFDVYRTGATLLLLGALGLAAARPALRRWAPVGALAFLGLGCTTWDAQAPDRRTLGDPRAQVEVRRLLANRPGAVAWLGGDLEPALLAGRPSWRSELQGASNVFSRVQALEWTRRGRRLVETGVASPQMLAPYPRGGGPLAWTPTRAAVQRLCADADAPAWIATPLLAAAPGDLLALGAKPWTAPNPEQVTLPGGEIALTDRTLFIPCRAAG